MRKYALFLMLFSPSLFADQAQSFPAPSSGIYYYCDAAKFSIKQLAVTRGNVKNLGKQEITIVCNSEQGRTCSLSSLIFQKMEIKNINQFVWTPKEGVDCGMGCNIPPILFSKVKKDIKDCAH